MKKQKKRLAGYKKLSKTNLENSCTIAYSRGYSYANHVGHASEASIGSLTLKVIKVNQNLTIFGNLAR